jgi:hypothetical protein
MSFAAAFVQKESALGGKPSVSRRFPRPLPPAEAALGPGHESNPAGFVPSLGGERRSAFI